MASDKSVITWIFISVLVDLLGFTVILPLFPALLDYYAKSENDQLYNTVLSWVESFRSLLRIPVEEPVTSVLFGGLLGALFSFLQYVNAPLLGALSDKYGRKRIIILSLFGSSFACWMWSGANTFACFVAARIVAGISEGNISICMAALADLEDKKAKSRGMAMVGVAYSIGFTVGPFVGAYMSSLLKADQEFFAIPAYFALAMCLLDIVIVYLFLPETLPEEKRASSLYLSWREGLDLINPKKMFAFRAVRMSSHDRCCVSIIGLAYFLYLFFFSGLEFTLTFLTHNRFGFTRMDQGKMFAVLGVIMTLVQGGYIRRAMIGREIAIAKRSICVLIVGFVLIGFATEAWVLYAGLVPFAYAAASVVPCLSSAVSNYGGISEKGRVMGTLRSLGALARATGPCFASVLYWLLGSRFAYVLGGLLLLLPLKVLKILDKVQAKHAKEN